MNGTCEERTMPLRGTVPFSANVIECMRDEPAVLNP